MKELENSWLLRCGMYPPRILEAACHGFLQSRRNTLHPQAGVRIFSIYCATRELHGWPPLGQIVSRQE
jgi:hypothetical protein